MDRNRLAALAFAGLVMGGAWWWWRRANPGETGGALDSAPAGGVFAELFAPLVQPVESLAASIGAAAEDAVQAVTPGPWAPPARAAPYLGAIAIAETQYGIPRNMLARLLYQESRFRDDVITGRTRSSVGALGIAQFMPATAAEMGIDPLDPWQAIDAAGRYLARLYKATGNWQDALGAYNWGIGNVQRKGLAAAPAETRNYVAQITGDIGYV